MVDFHNEKHYADMTYTDEQYVKDLEEDCPNADLPPIMPAQKRIIVIGDLHGDYKLTVECLKIAGVVQVGDKNGKDDKDVHWTNDKNKQKTYVVQIGDQIDRCRPKHHRCDHPDATLNDEHSDIKIMELLTRLDKEAKKKGGRVISLLGNHEIMNVNGNMNYVSYLGLKAFEDDRFESGMEGRRDAFKRGNKYAKFMACSRLSAVVIGDMFFVHAGVVPEFTDKMKITGKKDLYKINMLVRKWLLGKVNNKYVDKIVNSSCYSMFWDRELGGIPPNTEQEADKCGSHLKPVLDIFKVGHMFVGHTVQPFTFKDADEGITGTCDNRLWRVDNGASQAFLPFDQTYLGDESKKKTDDRRKAMVLEITNDGDTRFKVLI